MHNGLPTESLALRDDKESYRQEQESNFRNFGGLRKLLAKFEFVMKAHFRIVVGGGETVEEWHISEQTEYIQLMTSTVHHKLLCNIYSVRLFDSALDEARREPRLENYSFYW